MAKNNMSLNAILGGFNQIKDTSDTIENVGWDGLIEAELIDYADKNNYAASDNADSIKSLADQINVVGLLNPLGVIKKGGRYQLFSGERRYRAITTHLQWSKIPCRVFENTSPAKAQLMLHIANGTREYSAGQKLQLYEEYHDLLIEMKNSGEYTGALQKGIAELLNVSDRQVRTYKKLSDELTPQEKESVVSGETSMNEALISAAEHKDKASLWQMPEPPISEQLDRDAVAEAPLPDASIDWEPVLAEAIKHIYHCAELYHCYSLAAMTPKEAIKAVLKPENDYSGGTVLFKEGCTGFHTRLPTRLEIEYRNQTKFFSYAVVDATIRQLIRDKELVSEEDALMLTEQFFEGGTQ